MKHASYLELDRYALGVPAEPETLAHLASCGRCSAYVAKARESSLAAVPDWVADLDGGGELRPRALRRWAAPLLLAASLFGGLLLVQSIGREPRAPEAYVGAKGGPSVGVYIKRDHRVFLWDGAGVLHAGDDIRLGVAGAEYRHIAVLSAERGTPVVLYRGELTAEGELPVAWSVDDQGDAERLIVVLSRRVLSDVELAERAGAAEVQETEETWVRKYILPKRRGSQP